MHANRGVVRARVLTRWVAYYAFALLWLIFLAFMMIERIRTSSLGSSTELTIGMVVLGGVLLAALVGFPLWVLPNVRCRTELCRRFPDAVVLVARRDDFRPFIDVDALDIPYRRIPYFLTVVGDRVDSIRAGRDRGSASAVRTSFYRAVERRRATATVDAWFQRIRRALPADLRKFPRSPCRARRTRGWFEDELPQT